MIAYWTNRENFILPMDHKTALVSVTQAYQNVHNAMGHVICRIRSKVTTDCWGEKLSFLFCYYCLIMLNMGKNISLYLIYLNMCLYLIVFVGFSNFCCILTFNRFSAFDYPFLIEGFMKISRSLITQ